MREIGADLAKQQAKELEKLERMQEKERQKREELKKTSSILNYQYVKKI